MIGAPERAAGARGRHAPALACAAYVALVLFATFPLVLHVGTHVPMPRYLAGTPSRHVYWFMLWSLWFAKHWIATRPLQFSTALIFYPVGVAIPWLGQVVSAAVFAIPLLSVLNLVAVGNLLMLAGLVAGAQGTYLLACDVVRDRRAAFLAGAIVATAPIVIANAQGHLYVITALAWLPLYVRQLLRTLASPAPGRAALAGAWFAASMLSYWYDAAFLVVFTVIAGMVHLAAAGRRWPEAARALLLPAAAFLAVVVPVAVVIALPFVLGGGGAQPTAPLQGALSEMREWSVDLVAFVLPTYDHWLFGPAVSAVRASLTGNFTLQSAYVGVVTLALALVAVVRAPRATTRVWVASALVFFALALGPYLHVGGADVFEWAGRRVSVPLPQQLVARVPPLSGVRDLSMYIVPLMLSLAVLAAVGLAAILDRVDRRRGHAFAAAAVLLVVADFAVLPFPLAEAGVPSGYDAVARDARAVSVLDLPLSTTTPQYQFFQAVHGKPLLSGYLNRLHPWYEQYGEHFDTMRALRGGAGERVAPDDAAAFARFFGVGYIAVHRDVAGAREADRLEALVTRAFPATAIASDRGTTVYRLATTAPPALPVAVHFAPGERDPVLRLGWHAAEPREDGVTAAWTDGTTGSLWVELPATDATVSVRVQPFAVGDVPQVLGLAVNGRTVASLVLPGGWSTQSFRVRGEWIVPGVNRLDFSAARCLVPADLLPGSTDTRCLGVAFSSIRIE